ncbi:MAG: TerC family protein [Steroidobacteraceae bacterium]|jgi:predicted tellurium resistance membrane protein TerC
MAVLSDPQAWLSFLTLTGLEIVLGIDNILLLSVLVERLPQRRRSSARFLGSGFAMLTRIALLLSVVWITTLRRPLFTLWGLDISVRDAVLFAGGVLLVIQSVEEIVGLLKGRAARRTAGTARAFWLIIVQIGILDILFSLDSVFTAIGLARRVEVMIAAIVVSVFVMIAISSTVSRFIGRHPTLKALALVFLVLVGLSLIAEGVHVEIPQGYLYFAIGFSAVVAWVNIRLRRRG